jgi:two-component system phosphate regulon sensor histidine kinase PhoR
MNRFRSLALLMAIAILGITGFQAYWLKQNYAREEKSLALKTDLAFRETIINLQGEKLNLEDVRFAGKSGKPGLRIFVAGGDNDDMRGNLPAPRQEIISTVNVISDKMRDSLKREVKSGMMITMNKTAVSGHGDTIRFNKELPPPGGKDYIFNLLYGVDSLQDSIRVSEIDSAYHKRLKQQKLNVPYAITRLDSATATEGPKMNSVTIGFAKPVTYHLQLGNVFPYLMKQIIQPVLFSILLLGITILSFVLLYRNLLRQRRLALLKNEFISNITHELKTPIATVAVAIEALKNFNAIEDPRRTKEYLDISGNELQRLSLLVDKVLKLTMFEKKEIELKYEDVELKEVTNEVVASLRLQFEKHHAMVNVESSGNTQVRGDRLHLLSVIFNLLDNALKYSRDSPQINIQIAEKGDNVELVVLDNGIGITDEYRQKIFDKFFRIPHGDTHNAKGYGLGLSYVAQVIRKHHGNISVTSVPDKGSRFVITIPKTETI